MMGNHNITPLEIIGYLYCAGVVGITCYWLASVRGFL